MSSINSKKGVRSDSRSKNLFMSSAASVLSSFAFMAVAQTANAQVNVTDCASIPDNPGVADAGETVNLFLSGQTCTVASGDIIELEDGDQDDITINIQGGTTLESTDTSDEDVVVFIDNSENNTRINVGQNATLSGANGVIFIEGDGTTIVNNGNIIGTGAAEEGVIYVDRDTDSDEILIVNGATGQIIAQDNGPAIGIETLIADGTSGIGVAQPLADYPTVRIVNRAGGLIQTTGSASDDNDAINIAGAPGTTGGEARTCIEGTAINCNVNLNIVNSGTIESIFDNSSSAGITIEDDAVFHGLIVNRAGGLITGTRNGMRIGDVEVDGATADHTGIVNNSGSITGTGDSSRGIDLEGSGVRVSNTATGAISGVSVGIEVGAGTSGGVEHRGVNNLIVNRGAITGGNYSVDSNSAQGAIRIVNAGGSLNGDLRGSVGNDDLLAITQGTTDLTHDVLQDFNVRVSASGVLNFVGDRTIEGELFSGGTLNFDLSNTQTVTGDVRLLNESTVAISDTSQVAGIGDQFTLISVGGTLTNNALLDASEAASDSSFLLDFNFIDSTDLVVEAVAAGGSTLSAKDKVSGYVSDIAFIDVTSQSFGGNVLNAFVEGGLNGTTAFSNLVALGSANDVGSVLQSLAPDYSGTLAQNMFDSVQNGAAQIDQRLNDLNCGQFYDARQTSSLNSSTAQGCQSFAQTGSWTQVSSPYATEGSLSVSAPAFSSGGGDRDSVTLTYGYDHALNDETIVGFTGSFTETEIGDEVSNVSSTDLDVMQFGAYAGHRIGNVNFVSKASYLYGQAETRRQSYEVIKSDVGLQSFNAQSVASYNVDLGKGLYLKPEAGLLYDNVTTSAYTESGGLNLNVGETSSNVLDARMGLTLGARRQVSDALRADAYVTGAVVDDLYGQRGDIGYSFGGHSGLLASRSLDNFAVQGLMGLNVLSGDNFSFGAALNSEFSDTETAVGTSLRTKLRW